MLLAWSQCRSIACGMISERWKTAPTGPGWRSPAAYSSAAEFEAEIIRERRAAGAYANPRIGHMRAALAATAVASLAALLLLIT